MHIFYIIDENINLVSEIDVNPFNKYDFSKDKNSYSNQQVNVFFSQDIANNSILRTKDSNNVQF